MNVENQIKKTEWELLESVGVYYNTKTGFVYPVKRNLEPDLNMGSLVSDCSDEWLDKLSTDDYMKIEKIHFLHK